MLLLYSEQPPNEGGGQDEAAEGGVGGLTDADFDSNWDESIETFDGMELPEELLRGIYSYGFEKPSAIQQRAIKPTMLGRDLIAQAQSGTVRFLSFTMVGQWLESITILLSGTEQQRPAILGSVTRHKGRTNFVVKHHLSSLNRVTLDVSEKALIT